MRQPGSPQPTSASAKQERFSIYSPPPARPAQPHPPSLPVKPLQFPPPPRGGRAAAERVCRPPRPLSAHLSPRAGRDSGPTPRRSARGRPRPRPLPPAAPPGVLGRRSSGRSDGGRGAGGGAGGGARAHLRRWRSGPGTRHLQGRSLCLGGTFESSLHPSGSEPPTPQGTSGFRPCHVA